MEVLRVPLLNANEDELTVVGVHVREGAEVRAGDLLFSVESTKATSDVEAPCRGYVRGISVAEGDRVSVGAVLCVITESAGEPLPDLEPSRGPSSDAARATRRARELADRHGIDLASLGVRGIVRERDVLAALEQRAGRVEPIPISFPEPAWGPNPIVILGAGGHARVIVDLLREGHRDLTPVGALDDADIPAKDVLGVPVIGRSAMLAALRERVEYAALGVGAVTHNATRVELYERLRAHGYRVPNLIHPRASIEPSVRMGEGNQIFAGAIVGSNARLGDDVIVNSGAVVSHDCVIGSHAHITPGAILAGGVTVGERSVIGMGVTVFLGVSIGRDVVISNGVHVLRDVPDGTVVRQGSIHTQM